MADRDWGMPELTTALGGALAVLGVVGYVATGMVSVTALIPTFFGVPLVALGLGGRRPARRKTVMHVAVVLTLLGLVGSARGLPGLLDLIGGADVARPAAVVAQSLMALLCLTHLVFGVRSFVRARRDAA